MRINHTKCVPPPVCLKLLTQEERWHLLYLIAVAIGKGWRPVKQRGELLPMLRRFLDRLDYDE